MVKDALVLNSGDPEPGHEKGTEMVLSVIPPSAQLPFTSRSAAPDQGLRSLNQLLLSLLCFLLSLLCFLLCSQIQLRSSAQLSSSACYLNPLCDMRVSPVYSPHGFLPWTINSERTWAVHFDLCSTQHSKLYLMNVLDEDEPLKLEADVANAYLIEGY